MERETVISASLAWKASKPTLCSKQITSIMQVSKPSVVSLLVPDWSVTDMSYKWFLIWGQYVSDSSEKHFWMVTKSYQLLNHTGWKRQGNPIPYKKI